MPSNKITRKAKVRQTSKRAATRTPAVGSSKHGIAPRGNRAAWLGREDSNLRMAESKSAALPLGYAPSGGGVRAAAAGGP